MKKLKELYQHQKDHGKFRFIDWGHRTKYLKIVSHDQATGIFHCVLDDGEKIEISDQSDFWQNYLPGDELRACAV